MFTLSGILLGFIGIGIIFGGDVKNLFDRNHLIGVISLILAVIGWAVGSIYSKYKKINVHPLMSASVQMIIAGLILTILAAGLGEFNNLILTKDGLLAFLYLLIVGSLVGYASYIYAIAHLPVSFVSTYAYINPIIALFLGWLILNETISANIIIASAIILAGVILVKRGTEKT